MGGTSGIDVNDGSTPGFRRLELVVYLRDELRVLFHVVNMSIYYVKRIIGEVEMKGCLYVCELCRFGTHHLGSTPGYVKWIFCIGSLSCSKAP